MITKKEILKLAEAFQLRPDVIEKDYVLGWLLAGISSQKDLFHNFIFKGGLLLSHYIQIWRETRDIDFLAKDINSNISKAENIFAEKLESIVSKMDANTRIKDYHDIFLLCREKKILNASKLKEEIIKVFKKRGTKKTLPIQFSEVEVNNLQKLLEKHTENLNKGFNFTYVFLINNN